jgi:hypothetical protein
MLEHADMPPAFGGLKGTEESSCAGAKYQGAKLSHQE